MYLQTVMLLLRGEGLDSCPQEAWSWFHHTVAEVLDPDPALMMFCGMAVGWKDRDEPANALVTDRLPIEDFVTFVS